MFIKSSIKCKGLSNCSAILIVFYQNVTIISTINKEKIIIMI